MLPVESSVTVVAGGAVTADFKLEWINPGPVRLESKFSGDVPDTLPTNGRNYLNAGQLEPGVQAVGRKDLRSRQEWAPIALHQQPTGTHHALRR